MRHIALVPAAGFGQRFGGDVPKQYTLLAGTPMLAHTVAALLAFEAFELVMVVVSPSDTLAAGVLHALSTVHEPRLRIAHVGGDSRADTVRHGLNQIPGDSPCTVWVHDAARPAISHVHLQALMAALQASPDGAVLATPVADTVKQAAGQQISATLERSALWQAQTPQCFELNQLRSALARAQAAGITVTDEASAMEAQGEKPTLVAGSSHNFKVTTPQDALLMEAVLSQRAPKHLNIAIGEGMDVHALVAGRPLILGGVSIPHHAGLLGHSDADALLHAITDALLGAAGLGDIGRMFPDTDAAYAGADSQVLLKKAHQAVAQAGWRVSNVDATIVAQAPKLAAFIPAMQVNIAACLNVLPAYVNVKAKTNERLGWLGRQEGMEARAVVLLQRI